LIVLGRAGLLCHSTHTHTHTHKHTQVGVTRRITKNGFEEHGRSMGHVPK